MKFDIEEKLDKRIGIFSDLHVGVSSDSKTRLNESVKCIDWIIKEFKKESVDWVIFCGDLFNSRYSINVNTLNIGIEIIENFIFNFEKVFLIEGNHDTYYKNSNSVNSVKFFQKIGKNDNVFVIDEKPMFLKINGTSFGLYPWGTTPDSINEIKDFEIPDYGFGHFELNGVETNGGSSYGNKYELADMFNLGNMIFSGHYHINKIYKDLKSNKILYMVGSPLQLDWGDYGREKKTVVLDTETKGIKELLNTKNAQFKKVFYSSFEKDEYDDGKLKNLCHHNFIKFIIDKEYNFDKILQYNEKIKSFDPYLLELEYLISMANNTIMELDSKNVELKSKTNKDYIIDFIDNVFQEYNKDQSLDINLLKTRALSYYDKSQLAEDERKEEILE